MKTMTENFWDLKLNPITMLGTPTGQASLKEEVIRKPQKRKKGTKSRSESKGYVIDKLSGKFKAYIQVNCKKIFLGSFETPEEAREVYLEAVLKYRT